MGAKEERYLIGTRILKEMNRAHDLPLPNARILAREMHKRFKEDGYVDDLREQGSKWNPKPDYWQGHIQNFADVLRREGRFFAFVHNGDGFDGLWKFATKKEMDEELKRGHNELSTRTENHNNKVEDAKEKWGLEIPTLKPIAMIGQ